jgi:hypothetical protein
MPATTYKKTYPALYVKICKEGGSICDFCCEVNVVRSTFYEWVDAHEEFREAFHLGKEYTEAWLTKTGVSGMKGELLGTFNSTAWSILMRNKCGYSEHRRVAVDFSGCKTSNDKMAVVDRMVSQGKLTTKEAKDFADYIAAGVKVDENTEGKQRLEAVEESLGIKK